MPTVIIEHRGDEIDCDSYGGDVEVFVIHWDDVADTFDYAVDTYELADDIEEPHRTRIRDTIETIWPSIASGYTEE